MTLNGTQIDALLEQQFENISFGSRDILLQVSKGFSYTWNKSAPVGKKVNISNIKINGTSIDPISLYRVTVDSFMAEGGNNLSVLKAGVNRTVGFLDDINVTSQLLQGFLSGGSRHMDRIAVVR